MNNEIDLVRWKQIKYNPGKMEVTLKYVQRENGSKKDIDCSMTYPNEPRDVLKKALLDLRQHVLHLVAITGAERQKQLEQIEVRGVNFSEDSNGEKAQMIVVRRIPNGDNVTPLNYNTPQIHSFLHDDESDVMTWDADCVEVLDRLKDAAIAYLHGDRVPVSELTGESQAKEGGLFNENSSEVE